MGEAPEGPQPPNDLAIRIVIDGGSGTSEIYHPGAATFHDIMSVSRLAAKLAPEHGTTLP